MLLFIMASTRENSTTALITNIDDKSSTAPVVESTTPVESHSAASPLHGRNNDNNQDRPNSSRANYGTVNPVDVTRSGHRGEHHNQPFPAYRPGFNPDGTHAIQITDDGHIIQNVNAYQQKKMITQGMMDLALLSANANQLRYVLESCQDHPFFEVIIVLISTSITIQVLVGMGLIWKSQYNTINENNYQEAKRISNLITIGIFLITLVNVMISAFNIAEIKSPSHLKQQ